MSLEEQINVTNPLLPEIEELREMKKLAIRNVPLESFQDASSNLKTLEKEVCFCIIFPHFSQGFLITRSMRSMLALALN
jgi:hypothetical protein